MQSIDDKIIRKSIRSKKAIPFFVESFKNFGNENSVYKALERLVNDGKMERLAAGIYVYPKKSKLTGGKLYPSIDEIAVAIAKREKARIIPTGSYAMYKLGLTTQMPMNVVYYTDTTARVIKIGERTIKFKKASSRNLAYRGDISMLAIQALREIGKGKVSDKETEHLKHILLNENSKHLQHDLLLAPAWIRALLTSKTNRNE